MYVKRGGSQRSPRRWLYSVPKMTDIPDAVEMASLQAIQREYAVTMRVLAVVVELLLGFTEGDSLAISDEVLVNGPDILAMRNADNNGVELSVFR